MYEQCMEAWGKVDSFVHSWVGGEASFNPPMIPIRVCSVLLGRAHHVKQCRELLGHVCTSQNCLNILAIYRNAPLIVLLDLVFHLWKKCLKLAKISSKCNNTVTYISSKMFMCFFKYILFFNQMGRIGEKFSPEFVISAGDNFYPTGLKGTNDPDFTTSFTNVYTAASLQIPWYAGLSYSFCFFSSSPNSSLTDMMRSRSEQSNWLDYWWFSNEYNT